MKIKYNVEKLRQIISDLSLLTGISMAFLDSEYHYLCRCTREYDFCTEIQYIGNYLDRCDISDRTVLERCKKSRCFECHICHAGLYDAAMPIIKDDVFVGVVIMGRVRLAGAPGVDEFLADSRLKELYFSLPELRDEQIASIQTLLPNILFQNAVFLEYDSMADEIGEYIEKNLTENIGVKKLCDQFGVSANGLYKIFKDNFDCTVNEYITSRRISKAKALLRYTKEPVYIVAEKVGIDNYTYFCKLFKRKENVSPAVYRKSLISE